MLPELVVTVVGLYVVHVVTVFLGTVCVAELPLKVTTPQSPDNSANEKLVSADTAVTVLPDPWIPTNS